MDEYFFAGRNAAVVLQAEPYYRAMFGRRQDTWNLRDAHMGDTLLALSDYRRRRSSDGRIVVWAHNSHLGDARATEMHSRGEWNLGKLLRQHSADKVLLVGFTTYTGHVSAASRWNGDVECKWVRPARLENCEHLFHTTGMDRFFLPLNSPAAGLSVSPCWSVPLEFSTCLRQDAPVTTSKLRLYNSLTPYLTLTKPKRLNH